MTEEFYPIYKSQQKRTLEGDQLRNLIACNEGNVGDESRKPVEILRQFSEHNLTGRRRLELLSASDSFILVPIEDELQVNHVDFLWTVAPQEVMLLSSDQIISIENQFSSEMSRFYTIQIKIPHVEPTFHSFEITGRNQLVSLFESTEMSLKMGVFDARQHCGFRIPDKQHSFVSIVNGTFEFQNRLLESNDSFLIPDGQEMEFQSLTENAAILVFSF